jgi:hypothetical protein
MARSRRRRFQLAFGRPTTDPGTASTPPPRRRLSGGC